MENAVSRRAQLTGAPFSTVFDLAKTDWLTTLDGVSWEQDFLSGSATAAGTWESAMDYVQRYIDIGMFYTDPGDRRDADVIQNYLGSRKAVFCMANSYAEEAGLAYNVQVIADPNDNFLRACARGWMEEQGTVFPDTPWE